MRLTTQSALFALSLLPPLIHAVSLSDMKPRAENLPDDCNDIYTSQISGCGIPDFTTQSCTDTCVKALQAMVGPIKEACGGQGVTGQNLVVAFLANVGPQQICPNAEMGSSAAAASTAQSTPSSSPSPTSAGSTTTTAATSEAESSETVQSTSLLVDTSSAASSATRTRTPAFSGTTTAPSLTREQTSTSATSDTDQSSTTTLDAAGASSTDDSSSSDQQTGGNSSGGGSPFDDEGNMFSGADSLSSTSVLVSLGIAVVVAVFLFR